MDHGRPRAAVTWRVCSRIARGEVYRHACASSGVGSRNAAHTAGMVVGASARGPGGLAGDLGQHRS